MGLALARVSPALLRGSGQADTTAGKLRDSSTWELTLSTFALHTTHYTADLTAGRLPQPSVPSIIVSTLHPLQHRNHV